MIIGQYSSKLTEKERISVPKKFREELGEDLVIAKWYEKCLVLVSKEKWEELMGRVVGDPGLIISPVRDIDRFVLGSAYEVGLDSQGRFVLPEILKRYAEVEEEVTFVGLGDRVEIWNSKTWFELQRDAEEKAYKAIERIANHER